MAICSNSVAGLLRAPQPAPPTAADTRNEPHLESVSGQLEHKASLDAVFGVKHAVSHKAGEEEDHGDGMIHEWLGGAAWPPPS